LTSQRERREEKEEEKGKGEREEVDAMAGVIQRPACSTLPR
jgi:hypothetical protein